MSDKLCIRNFDGTVWEPSHPDHWTDGDALASLVSGTSGWYLRRVDWRPAPWWAFWTSGKWVRTGEIWEPESGEFLVEQRNRVWHP